VRRATFCGSGAHKGRMVRPLIGYRGPRTWTSFARALESLSLLVSEAAEARVAARSFVPPV
jgi:hypothetical protein